MCEELVFSGLPRHLRAEGEAFDAYEDHTERREYDAYEFL
jgi:hypothetical protein